MEIVFHVHNAAVSDRMRRKADSVLRKIAKKTKRPVDGVVRFHQDGARRTVELALHAAGGRRYIASVESRYFGTALSAAARRLSTQVMHAKRVPKTRARALARARSSASAA